MKILAQFWEYWHNCDYEWNSENFGKILKRWTTYEKLGKKFKSGEKKKQNYENFGKIMKIRETFWKSGQKPENLDDILKAGWNSQSLG